MLPRFMYRFENLHGIQKKKNEKRQMVLNWRERKREQMVFCPTIVYKYENVKFSIAMSFINTTLSSYVSIQVNKVNEEIGFLSPNRKLNAFDKMTTEKLFCGIVNCVSCSNWNCVCNNIFSVSFHSVCVNILIY